MSNATDGFGTIFEKGETPSYPSGGAYSGGSSGGIVFKPGVASAGDHYATAAEVAAALTAVGGAATVYCDNSLATCTIPTGVTWDFKRLGWITGSYQTNTGYILHVDDGGQIRNCPRIVQGYVEIHGQTRKGFDFDSAYWLDGTARITLEGAGISCAGSMVAGGVFTVPAGGMLGVQLISDATIIPSGAAPILLTTAAGPLLGGIVYIYGIGVSAMTSATGLVAGDATTTVRWHGDSTMFPVPTFPAFTGTLVPTMLSGALGESYTPTTVADWSGTAPTSVANALDRLAAKAGPVLAAPIKFSQTLTGPGATAALTPIPMQTGVNVYTLKCTARVTSTSGGSETVNDSYATEYDSAWLDVGGVVTQMSGAGVPNPEWASTSMVGTLFQASTDGAVGLVNVTLPNTLDASTVVTVTVEVKP